MDFANQNVNEQIGRFECFQFDHEKIISLRGIMLSLINNLIKLYNQNKNNNDMISSIDEDDSMSVIVVKDELKTCDESVDRKTTIEDIEQRMKDNSIDGGWVDPWRESKSNNRINRKRSGSNGINTNANQKSHRDSKKLVDDKTRRLDHITNTATSQFAPQWDPTCNRIMINQLKNQDKSNDKDVNRNQSPLTIFNIIQRHVGKAYVEEINKMNRTTPTRKNVIGVGASEMFPYRICRICLDYGHNSNACPKNVEKKIKIPCDVLGVGASKPIKNALCKKCNDWGHYANACPKYVEDKLRKNGKDRTVSLDLDKYEQKQSNEAQSFGNDNEFKSK